MDNLFDFINQNTFSIFSRDDRAGNYALLSYIYSLFSTKRPGQSIKKNELIDALARYIKETGIFLCQDSDGSDLGDRPYRERAIAKVRQFTNAGWIEEDVGPGFSTLLSLSDDAITMLSAFASIVKKKSHPLEFTGYFFVIYDTLNNFDLTKSKALLEQVSELTTDLFNALQGLSSSIKHFIERLLSNDAMTPSEVLDILLYRYQEQIVVRAFNNLKGKDNPSLYTSGILAKLKELRFKYIDSLSSSYLESSGIKDASLAQQKITKNEIITNLEEMIDKFDNVDEYIASIDRRNAKFLTSSVAKLTFLLTEGRDVDALLVEALKNLKDVPEEADFSSLIPLSSCKSLEADSLYFREASLPKAKAVVADIPSVKKEDVDAAMSQLLSDNVFTKEEVNSFALKCLDGKDEVSSTSLKIDSLDSLALLLLMEVYSSYDDMVYSVKFHDDLYLTYGYYTESFDILKKERVWTQRLNHSTLLATITAP